MSKKPKRLTSSRRRMPSDSKNTTTTKKRLIFTFACRGRLERYGGCTAASSPFIQTCQCSFSEEKTEQYLQTCAIA